MSMMPSTASAVASGRGPSLPVKIWNSAMKPENPDNLSEANAATPVMAANAGAEAATPEQADMS